MYSQNFTSTFIANYKLSFKLDSLAKYNKEEHFDLLFNPQKSYFISVKTKASDTIKISDANGAINANNILKGFSFFPERIFCESPSNRKNIFLRYTKNNYFNYIDESSIVWKIENERKIINSIPCIKATCDAYGRKWIAYYSPSYPFNFGPYKFSGLPGLIISLNDINGNYNFEVTQISVVSNTINEIVQSKELNKDNFFRLLKDKLFSMDFFNKFSIPDDPGLKDQMMRAYKAKIKSYNNFPLDKSMMYIFAE